MSIISFNNVYKHFGAHEVLSGISFTVEGNAKIGLIGPNGAGKTTILKLILGSEEPSQGAIVRNDGVRIGYVPQYPDFHEGCTVTDALTLDLQRVKRRLRDAEERLGRATDKDLDKALHLYQEARDAYDAMNGDESEERMVRLMASFGLEGKEQQQVSTLSGGERNILSLAKATFSRPDLLILDEPGNHLDYIGLDWLEERLSSYPAAVLLVSHNRYLLDRVARTIFEMENRAVTVYSGNYSDYRRIKLQKLVNTQSDYIANQKRLARLEALVKRFEQIARSSADPAWGKRYRARRTQLEKERAQAVEKPELDTRAMRLGWQGEQSRADIALQINGYSAGFDGKQLFNGAQLRFSCGERVALVGPNGSGKTTLLKDIVSRGDWNDQILRIGPSLTIGYCAQNQEVFDPKKSVLSAFIDLGTQNRKETFKLLSRFLFDWEDLDKRIGSLSGGEMNRLQLARLEAIKANFLVLDEPTNHLDVGSKEAIEEALDEFKGTLLVVSHDRYFLDKIADIVVEIKDGRLEVFNGNFTAFWRMKKAGKTGGGRGRELGKRRQAAAENARRSDRGARRSAGEVSPGGLSPAAGGLSPAAGIETRIEKLEAERAMLESQITAAFSAGDHQRGRKLSNDLADVSRLIDKLYVEWEEYA